MSICLRKLSAARFGSTSSGGVLCSGRTLLNYHTTENSRLSTETQQHNILVTDVQYFFKYFFGFVINAITSNHFRCRSAEEIKTTNRCASRQPLWWSQSLRTNCLAKQCVPVQRCVVVHATIACRTNGTYTIHFCP